MIERLEVLNYRSVLGRGPDGDRTPAILDIEEDITTLIGKNEAGKSNLLRAANRFRDRRPLPRSDLSNYADYSNSPNDFEILRCRLTPGAFRRNSSQVKQVPWLLGPYHCEELSGFPVREQLIDIMETVREDYGISLGHLRDIDDLPDQDVVLPMGQVLSTGHVDLIHSSNGDHTIDIIPTSEDTGTSDVESVCDDLEFPMPIDEFLGKRFTEHNVVKVTKLNPEIEEVGGITEDEVDSVSDLSDQIGERLSSISEACDNAEPIQKLPEDAQDEAAYMPPDIYEIQLFADDLLRTLNNVDNPVGPISDLPIIVDQSEIDLADSEYDLREDQDDPMLQGLLALDSIDLTDFDSYSSPRLHKSLDNSVAELSKYLNAFWDFNPEDRQPQDTITPGQTDRYTFQYELDGETVKLKLAEGDSPATPLDQRSDGMRWIITFLLTILAQPYGQSEGIQTLVTLDDPGIHLHPEAEKKLFRAFFYVTNQAQIVYTTHSPALIDRREVRRLRIIKHEIDEAEGRPIGTTVANDLDNARTQGEQVDPLATAREAIGWTLSDSLFRGEQTVLVEGPSDKRYLNMFNSYFSWNGQQHLDDDPTFVDSKGSQLPFLSRILAAENVTHVALMDDDSADSNFEQEIERRTVRYRDVLEPALDFDAEIEDLFDREFLIECASHVHEELHAETILSTPYDEAPVGIVEYIENFLEQADEGPNKLKKEELSREVKDQLQQEIRESPETHSETIAKFQATISALKERIQEVDV